MSSPHAEYIFKELRPILGGTEFAINTEGAVSDIMLVQDAPTPYVVKMIKQSYCETAPQLAAILSEVEANILEQINEAAGSPVALPSFLRRGIEPTPYICMSLVDGVSLEYKDIRRESSTIQYDYGQRIGNFIGWLASAVSIEDYHHRHGMRHPKPFDIEPPNITRIKQAQQAAEWVRSRGQSALAKSLLELHEFSNDRPQDTAALTVIGHNDLHQGNLLIDLEAKSLGGIVDFMLTQPSNPERELRYLAYYGKQVVKGAQQGFEATSGLTLDPELVQFWLASQITASAVRKMEEDKPIRPGVLVALEEFLPYTDWESLRQWSQQEAKTHCAMIYT